MFPLFRRAPVELAKRVLEDVVTADVDGEVLAAHPLVHALQLLAEVAPLDVKVEYLGVVDEHREWTVRQRSG